MNLRKMAEKLKSEDKGFDMTTNDIEDDDGKCGMYFHFT